MTIYLGLQGNIAEGVPEAFCYQSWWRPPLSEILRARDGQATRKRVPASLFLARSQSKTRNTKQNRMLLGFCRSEASVLCDDPPEFLTHRVEDTIY